MDQDLTPRRKAILAAVVEHHMATGEPLGSKELAGLLNDAPSSATLRSEMNCLCQMGYLCQPHTSAGRIPTGQGYRYYVQELMPRDTLSAETKRHIDDTLACAGSEELPQVAGELLTELTGLPALSASVSGGEATVHRVKLVPLGSRIYMLALMVSDGRVQTAVCHTERPLSEAQTELFASLVTRHVQGKRFAELTPGVMQGCLAGAGLEALNLASLFGQLFELLNRVGEDKVALNDESRLFSLLGEREQTARLLAFLHRKDGMLNLLGHTGEALSVVFGSQTAYRELSPSAVVVARFGPGKNGFGHIGVIGPTRMSYDRIIPSLEYLAGQLSRRLDETLKDMEE